MKLVLRRDRSFPREKQEAKWEGYGIWDLYKNKHTGRLHGFNEAIWKEVYRAIKTGKVGPLKGYIE